jgi:hypothetical protein
MNLLQAPVSMLLFKQFFLVGVFQVLQPDPSRSIALVPRHSAHFIPVKYYGHRHPVTGKTLPLDVDYQVILFGTTAQHLVYTTHRILNLCQAACEADPTGHELVLQVQSRSATFSRMIMK